MDKLLANFVANAAGIPERANEAIEKIRAEERAKLAQGYLLMYRDDGLCLGDDTYFRLFYCTKEEIPMAILADAECCKAFSINPNNANALDRIKELLTDSRADVVPISLLLHGITYDDVSSYKTDTKLYYKQLRGLLDPADRADCIKDN